MVLQRANKQQLNVIQKYDKTKTREEKDLDNYKRKKE